VLSDGLLVHPTTSGTHQRTFYHRRSAPPLVRNLGITDCAHEYVALNAVERHRWMPAYAPRRLVTYLDRAHRVTQV
jgi:hypothetical protein